VAERETCRARNGKSKNMKGVARLLNGRTWNQSVRSMASERGSPKFLGPSSQSIAMARTKYKLLPTILVFLKIVHS
jgi:hypothetical protein